MHLEDRIQRADQLIKNAGKVLLTEKIEEGDSFIDVEPFQAFRSASLSFLATTFGKDHTHYDEFDSEVKQAIGENVRAGRGILSAAREELKGGWLITTKGLVSAEIFADFLEMAQHLLDEGYEHPAAVVAGSVLEEHLRQLCQKQGIPTELPKQGSPQPKRADTLNADLTKNSVYNKLDQKNVTAWLDLRNKAAHGKYQEYTKEQVSLMVTGLSEFMVRIHL